MRLRTTLTGTGITLLAVLGVAVPAQAASWHTIRSYAANKKSACIDAGQEYEREGFPYRCQWHPANGPYIDDAWWLQIYN